MSNVVKNVRLIAEESNNTNWFDIYIVCSGNKEYLMPHRKNQNMYDLLKNGISIFELEKSARKVIADISYSGRRYVKGEINPRYKYRRNQSRQFEKSVNHLLTVVDEYLDDLARVV